MQCDSASQTEPTLALSLLVDYVAQSTLHEAGTRDPNTQAMHAVLAFARSTACGPAPAEVPLSEPAEVSHTAQEHPAMQSSIVPLHGPAEQPLNVGGSLEVGGNSCVNVDSLCVVRLP